MKVKELKEILGHMGDDATVSICVREPAGWICPDGAVVGVKDVTCGFDWHAGEVLIVPEHKLDIHDVEEWSGKKRKESESEEDDKEDPVESANRFVRTLEAAYEASKGSQMRFKQACEKSLGGLQTFK